METKLEQQMQAIECSTGLTLTLYDLRRRFASDSLPSERRIHHTAFCNMVKTRQEKECLRCDQEILFVECLEKREPFIRTCHAGADELIIPVMLSDELLCIVFLGQFIRGGSHLSDHPDPSDLPILNHSECENLVRIGEIITGFLHTHLLKRGPVRVPLSERIVAYMNDHLSSDPSLGDLAGELNLSLSRTRHLVKDVCEKSFQQVKNTVRMEVAKDMLAKTDASIAFISRQAGFNEVDYFYRFFKKHAGVTAGQFRRGRSALDDFAGA